MRHEIRFQECGSARRPRHRASNIAAILPTVAFLGLALAVPRPIQAAIFQCGTADAVCLINAINAANASGQTNTIRLAAGAYTLPAADNDTNGPNGLPSITSTLRLEGESAAATSLVRESSAPPFRLLHVGPAGNLTIDGVALTGGSAFTRDGGGAVFNDRGAVTITRSIVGGNSGSTGGGLFNNGGTVNILGSVVTGNRAGTGGGLANNDGAVTIAWAWFTDNTATGVCGLDTLGPHSIVLISDSRFTETRGCLEAGALSAHGGNVLIARSTFDRNVGDGAGAIAVRAFLDTPVGLLVADSAFAQNRAVGTGNSSAIGIYNTNGVALVVNTTFARNEHQGIGTGGAIANGGGLFLVNSTVADNSATFSGRQGGLWSSGAADTFTIVVNTILARNTSASLSQDCSGPVTSIGHNLIGNPVGCGIVLQPSDRTGDPGLGAFTDNGAAGNGHFPLLAASPAVDAGDVAVCPQTDQIGGQRRGPCDIGAIELNDSVQPIGGHDVVRSREPDPAASRTGGSGIAGHLLQIVTALSSPAMHGDERSRQLKPVLDLVRSRLSGVPPAAH